jgi:hypothetical protein
MNAMQISSILKAVMAPLENRSHQNLPRMHVGDQLSGEVLRLEADGRLLVDLGDFRAFAHSTIAARPGQTLQLEVIKTGIPIYLKTIGPHSGQADTPLPRMDFHQVLDLSNQQRLVTIFNRLTTARTAPSVSRSIPQTVQNAMARMASMFEPMELSRTPAQIAQWLKTTLEDSGLFFEKKLAEMVILGDRERPDAKGESPTPQASEPRTTRDTGAPFIAQSIGRDGKAGLLLLRHFLSSEPGNRFLEEVISDKEVRFLRVAVQRLIAHIEGQQEHAVQRSGGGDAYEVVSHWMPVEDQDGPLRVKLYYPKKKTSQKGQHPKVALLLDMDRLGLVRVDLSMVEQSLIINFYVQNAAVEKAVAASVARVEEALVGFFDQISIKVRHSVEKIAQFETEDTAAGAVGRVDIQA